MLRITFALLIAISVVGCTASSKTTHDVSAPTPATLTDAVEGTSWTRAGINDVWEFRAGGTAVTSEGLQGPWKAVDGHTVIVTFMNFFAVTFDDSFNTADARTRDIVQGLTRN